MRFTIAILALPMLLSSYGVVRAEDGSEDAAYKAIVDLVIVLPRDPKSDDCTVNISADFDKYTGQVDVFWNAFLNKE